MTHINESQILPSRVQIDQTGTALATISNESKVRMFRYNYDLHSALGYCKDFTKIKIWKIKFNETQTSFNEN